MGGPAGTQPPKAGPGQVRLVPTALQVAAQVHAWASVPSASRWKVCSPFMGHSGCCITVRPVPWWVLGLLPLLLVLLLL